MEESLEESTEQIEVENDSISEHLDVTKEVAGNSSSEKPKFVRLPLARVKHMMKMDPDCGLISQEALLLVTKSTELFLEFLAKQASSKLVGSNKKKTLQRKDVDNAIDTVPNLCFLEGALE